MNLLGRLTGFVAVFGMSYAAYAGDYTDRPVVDDFVQMMVTEHGFTATEINNILQQAEKKQAIIDAISKPAEKTKPWYEYREIFLGKDRIEQGVEFWQANADTLQKVTKEYGVEPQIIVAIIGVETRYGRYMGNYRVVDALATLGFDYLPRAKFFLGQLEQLFILAREQKQDPLTLFGSYAGAMGYGQFIPSSYRHYARDFDGDGFADIWQNKNDAISSVANYFKAHGWQTGKPVLVPATLAQPLDESEFRDRSRPSVTMADWAKKGVTAADSDSNAFANDDKALLLRYEQKQGWDNWLGFNNFYVITRYNRSYLYAMAVWQLSEAIASAKTQGES